jgi:hypothetical protein
LKVSEEKQEKPLKHRQAAAAIAINLNKYVQLSQKDYRLWTQQEADQISQFEQRIGPGSIVLLLRILGETRNEALTKFTEQEFDEAVEKRIYAEEGKLKLVQP